MNLKAIHIGALIAESVKEHAIEISRICNFLDCSEEEVQKMYECKSLDTELLLKWSKLIEYDFFRLYTQHLIFFAPQSAFKKIKNIEKSPLPQFRKNIYTKEVIDFIMELIETNEKTKLQIIEEYNIPKTTLYKWISKYKN